MVHVPAGPRWLRAARGRRGRGRFSPRADGGIERRRRRWPRVLAVLVALSLFVPVPWKHVVSESPPGWAFGLDGRLEVEGQPVDPPGRWSWLAVGRPQLLGEVLLDQVTGTDGSVADLRTGRFAHRPALSEPAAAAVGLRQAGWDLEMRLAVEASSPSLEGYPDHTLIEAVDGISLTDRGDWERAQEIWNRARQAGAERPDGDVTFRIAGGREFTAPGPGLPYDVVRTLDLAPQGLEAGITFGFARWLPVDWFRNLSLGSSHGAMVALTTYVEASGRDLAQGRHIAGTGGILGDGTVTRIGGLPAKARAARRAGADVLLVPASQMDELDDVDLSGMNVVPWWTLTDAIDYLAQPTA